MVLGRRNAGDSLKDCATTCPLNRVSTASAPAVVKDAFKTVRRFTIKRRFTINFRGFVWVIALSLRPLDVTGTRRAQVDTQRQWFLRPRPRRAGRRCRRQDVAANRRDRLGLPQRTNSGCLSPICDLSFICGPRGRRAGPRPCRFGLEVESFGGG